MKDVESKLPNKFFARIHRSYIVNVNKILSIEHVNGRLQIEGVEKSLPIGGSYKDELLKILSNSEIYHFYFNYRADYDADDAFLITNGQEIFIVVGKKADLDFIGLENKEEELPDDPDEEEIDNDEFDFSML